jgi:hypothetical protein
VTHVTWLEEILSILDESQKIRESLEALNLRVHVVSQWASLGPAINSIKVLEKLLSDAVDKDLLATAKKISTEKS